MMKTTGNIQSIWCNMVAEELARLGATHVCMSPGARSGLLATALARHPALQCVTHVDERASAFHALGIAKATERPAVWVTTSGTAVANGLPAVVEAAQDGIPMLLLTADRPPELRDTGANQAILQPSLFAPYTRWQVDLPCAESSIPPAYVLSTLDHAWARARTPDPGPVHINWMFREPLDAESAPVHDPSYLSRVTHWLESKRPWGAYATPEPDFAEEDRNALMDRIAAAENGVLLVGRLQTRAEREAAYELAQQLDYPVIADIGSGLRQDGSLLQLIPYADQILLAGAMFHPDLVLHIGGTFVSKRIQAWIESLQATYVLVKSHPRKQNPGHCANWIWEGGLSTFVRDLSRRPVNSLPAADLAAWRTANEQVQAVLASHASGTSVELDELYVAITVAQSRPPQTGLFLGNSMPIRDMDMFSGVQEDPGPVIVNRGASGIDGCLSAACGWARGAQRPVIAVLGDLALLHDLNGLDYVRRSPVPVIVVVINNNGGGIFSFLPAATKVEGPLYETCFGAAHDLHFSAAAQQFAIPYRHVRTRTEWTAALQDACTGGQSVLIEVQTDRARNVDLHRDIQARIATTVAESPPT